MASAGNGAAMMYARHESNQCGSRWTVIAKDLKTVTGLRNRILNGYYPVGRWYIYTCPEHMFYKRESHILVGMVDKQICVPQKWLALKYAPHRKLSI